MYMNVLRNQYMVRYRILEHRPSPLTGYTSRQTLYGRDDMVVFLFKPGIPSTEYPKRLRRPDRSRGPNFFSPRIHIPLGETSIVSK